MFGSLPVQGHDFDTLGLAAPPTCGTCFLSVLEGTAWGWGRCPRSFFRALGTAGWLPGPPWPVGPHPSFPRQPVCLLSAVPCGCQGQCFCVPGLGRRSTCFTPGSLTKWRAPPGLCFPRVGRPGCPWATPRFVGSREAAASVLLRLPGVVYDVPSPPVCSAHRETESQRPRQSPCGPGSESGLSPSRRRCPPLQGLRFLGVFRRTWLSLLKLPSDAAVTSLR